jgi:hypothetical protein
MLFLPALICGFAGARFGLMCNISGECCIRFVGAVDSGAVNWRLKETESVSRTAGEKSGGVRSNVIGGEMKEGGRSEKRKSISPVLHGVFF